MLNLTAKFLFTELVIFLMLGGN
jgi:hypothetical protein